MFFELFAVFGIHQSLVSFLQIVCQMTRQRAGREFFKDDEIDRDAANSVTGVLPSEIEEAWAKMMDSVLEEAQLRRPAASKMLSRGKQGEHTEGMGLLLAEMQSLARQHSGARW